jgi:hypothetical protein
MTLKPIQEKPDFWHYTNWVGLNGILKTSELWASHISYLNDSNEMSHAVKRFKEVVTKGVVDPKRLDWKKDVEDHLLNAEDLDVCVASFSTKGDDLSQWRGYAHPGPGFALGFRKLTLQKYAEAKRFRLEHCKYNQREQLEALAKIVMEFHKRRAEMSAHSAALNVSALKQKLLTKFAKLAPTLKSPSFEAENEWRLISPPLETLGGIDFHTSGSLLVPHFALPIGDGSESALMAVRIGPSPHMKLMEKSVNELVKVRGYRDVQVSRTKVPFRNW